eukprot:TRINITY_DN110202_c0_g1_i1.p3 TRINITY_DN110202_c0_g1~~TRINITY_DN110202_c0_g1_i1.p3  ORF type:complete len:111 (-),score=3.13 TRINITY_DN110202_c0_g1_i1:154-486(-)
MPVDRNRHRVVSAELSFGVCNTKLSSVHPLRSLHAMPVQGIHVCARSTLMLSSTGRCSTFDMATSPLRAKLEYRLGAFAPFCWFIRRLANPSLDRPMRSLRPTLASGSRR